MCKEYCISFPHTFNYKNGLKTIRIGNLRPSNVHGCNKVPKSAKDSVYEKRLPAGILGSHGLTGGFGSHRGGRDSLPPLFH